MTDEQIIQALECCYIHGKQCDKCRTNDFECLELEKITLDLIKRQKAEIEKLREHIELLDIEHEAIEISAVKKFAERLKDRPRTHLLLRPDSYYKQYIRVTEIDNVLKEVGVGTDV